MASNQANGFFGGGWRVL